MPPSAQSRIFISYAHRDGAELAKRLQKDLKAKRFDPWLDKQRLHGGSSWTKDIETALDKADFVLALLTPGSYVSEICRAEQLRSLRKGKCVIPLKAHENTDIIPLHLETKNYRDFTTTGNYTNAFAKLLEDLHARKGIKLKPRFRQTYVTAPPLPVNFVERPEALEALRDALITDDGGSQIALTALEGMSGIGKTVLAQALCHDEVVQQAFPDGVVWVTIGKEGALDVVTRMREVGKAFGDDLSRYDNELGAKNQYRSTIRDKAALIVVDDVWSVKDVEPFRAQSSPRTRLLFTTRDSSIAAAVGAREHVADLLTEQESRDVLARWSGTEVAKLPTMADDLMQKCGRLPLALSMVGAMLRGKPTTMWKYVNELLRNANLEKIKMQFPDYPHPNVFRAIQVSVNALDTAPRERYLALAVLLEEIPVSPGIQQCLWDVDEGEASETAEQFLCLSLAQRDRVEGSIRLHNLQLDYVRAQYPDRNALALIQGAVRLSANVIARDPRQFSSQLVGRLLPHGDTPAIGRFAARVVAGTRTTWLRPLQPTLHPAGTSLIRTLEGHSESVLGVAVSEDGRRAVSASRDNTLKVWDVDSGRALRTLEGHSDFVFGVAVSGDGRRAVSASRDKTLKVWDIDSGCELRTLKGHADRVLGVAVSGDGRRAVSASDDRTLKVWDVDSGRELRTLKGHDGPVNAVAVSRDGRRAVSASSDNTLKVWDAENGRELRTLEGHSDAVYGVVVSGDGQRAVSASSDNTLKVWELDSGREPRNLQGHYGPVYGVAVSGDGRRAVSASADNTLKVWDVDSGRQLRNLEGHADDVRGVAVSGDGLRAVSASADKTLKVWAVEGGSEVRTLQGHSAVVLGVAVSGDGRRAVSASADNTLKVWELDSGRELRTLEGHSTIVSGVAVSRDGRRAVSASWDHTLRVWELGSRRQRRPLLGHSGYVSGVAVSGDGRRAVSASSDYTLKVWDVENGRELCTLEGHSREVYGVAVSKDGRRAVSASADKTLKVWDVDSGRELQTLEGHSDLVYSVAVSGDGLRAVSASRDKTLKVWDVDSGREARSLQGHYGPVYGVAVSGDGRRAASASEDHTLKVWEIESGAQLATFTCDAAARCCAFGDNLKLIAGDEAGRVHFLRLEEPKTEG